MKEEWRPVDGHEEYEVSSLGNVRSIPREVEIVRQGRFRHTAHYKGKTLKATLDPQGRLCVFLSKNGTQWTHRVATLVAKAFLGQRPLGKEVCHKDDDKSDNSAVNLYWGTRRDNFDDAVRNAVCARGEKSHRAVLTHQQAQFILDTIGISECSTKRLARVFGVSVGAIRGIRKGVNWKYDLKRKKNAASPQ